MSCLLSNLGRGTNRFTDIECINVESATVHSRIQARRQKSNQIGTSLRGSFNCLPNCILIPQDTTADSLNI